jgi:hypothetical protein
MAKGRGAGPKVPNVSGKASGRTQNPKFAKGAAAGQVGLKGGSGMNVGGQTDAQVRVGAAASGKMLSKQFKKDKSTGLSVPGGKTPGSVSRKGTGKVKKP